MNESGYKTTPPKASEGLFSERADHTELINDRENWADIRRRVFHLINQGYIVKINASASEILAYERG